MTSATPSEAEDGRGRGSDENPSTHRLLLFTDAVAAIAITLLVLPLLDVVPEGPGPHPPLGTLLVEHHVQIEASILGFAVIYRYWWVHHRLFHDVHRLTPTLTAASVLWTFAVAFLPLPTAAVVAYADSPAAAALYGGFLLLLSLSSTMLAATIRRTSSPQARPRATRLLARNVVALAVIVAATVAACTIPVLNYRAFALVLLAGPATEVVARVAAARRRTTASPS